ncbi:precorrin 3B synthase CobZ [Neofusicoccum parvum]|nr:precorrin 3B synthase CobZ [Neofusicoccum parvum]
MPLPESCTVLVVGSGNAGLSAAISAAEHGASSVLLIDKCPSTWAGGNTYFTAGAYRTTHAGLATLLPLVTNAPPALAATIDLAPYPPAAFAADLARVTQRRASPALAATLVAESLPAVTWLRARGVRFELAFNRQAYRDGPSGRWRFWGGLALRAADGGKGLVAALLGAARARGVRVAWETPLVRLVRGGRGEIVAAVVRHAGRDVEVRVDGGVVLAAGGFEASPALRAQFLGPGWDLAHVRGTPYNTGEVLGVAVRDAGAARAGNWSGCHSVAWDADAPREGGDRVVTNEFTKSGYPLGVMVNVEGERFVDEGVDFRNYTYAKFGRAVLGQPDGVAFQVWDREGSAMLREEEYREEIVKRITADSLEELASKCAEVGLQNPEKFVRTVKKYNEAAHAHRKAHPEKTFNPAVKDGVATEPGVLDLPKSNWALPIEKPPFLAVKVGCGITFTFGGLAVDPETASVVSEVSGKPIEGLYAVGEMLGGLYYGNYPGGSGLTAGTVWGRRAGRDAAKRGQGAKSVARL